MVNILLVLMLHLPSYNIDYDIMFYDHENIVYFA